MENKEWFREGWLNLAAKAYGGKSRFDFGKIYNRIIYTPHCSGIFLSTIDMRAYNEKYTNISPYFI
jgi:hypothetical protein